MWKRFNQRKIWWEATQTARSKPLDRKDAKSIRAENKVAKQISKHKSVKHIFQGIRILDPDRFQGAGEIDTIAIADNAIFVVEVKNWGWDIVRDGEDIAQKRLLENGKKSEVIPKVNKKANDLTRWIRSLTNNCRLDIIPLVVLAHPKCKLSDDAKNLRTVTHIGDLHGKIDQLTPKSEKITSEEFDVICQTIEKFGRYDSISFDGGHIINGDFFELPFGWKRENVKSVEISILTSKWRSILLKPKLTLKIEKWDGKIEEQIIPLNGEAIAIKSPW